jgi:hypothetical protein
VRVLDNLSVGSKADLEAAVGEVEVLAPNSAVEFGAPGSVQLLVGDIGEADDAA